MYDEKIRFRILKQEELRNPKGTRFDNRMSVISTFKFWEFRKDVDREAKGNQTEYHKLWTIVFQFPCSVFHIIRSTVKRVKVEGTLEINNLSHTRYF